ncbi:MAG TPA: hypothetical protein VNZ48_09690 [Xanthobacteraceae bacterium]|nr:hypothetical protein [Xanthobacteraceae bacterium]
MTDLPTVGELIDLVAIAFTSAPETVVDEIARTAATPSGEDSDLSRETVLSYIKPPKTITFKGRKITRRNRLTPLHYKFAHLVINYLDGRRPHEKRLEILKAVKESDEWKAAYSACKKVLLEERDRRFERLIGSDPGAQPIIELVTGVYAVCRRESRDKRYHQELLILRNVGTKRSPHCHCTYVLENLVVRGEWMIIGNVVHCSMGGLRQDNSHDICGLYLSHHLDHEMLSGFLAGAGTEIKIPVAMPLVAMKINNADPSVVELGDMGDEAILRAFHEVKADITNIQDTLHQILSEQMTPVVFQGTECNPEIRKAFDDGKQLVHEGLRAFCKRPFN